MKKTIVSLAVFALAAAATSLAQPLVDGSFEADPAPAAPSAWTINLSGGTATNTTLYAQSGLQSLVIDSIGAGAWSSPNAFQSFPASHGDVFNCKGYMLRSGPITDASFGLLKMEFKDAGGAILIPASASIGTVNTSFPGVESTPFLNNGNVAANTWLFTELQGVAPVNTASVQFYLLNVNQGIAPGPMYFDNITATKVAVSPIIASITSPPNNSRRSPNFTISASATVAPGTVTNVAFYDGTTLLGNVTSEPFTWDVTDATLGNHALTVVAKASTGGSVTSSVVNVTVSTAVTVKVDPSKPWVGYLNRFDTNGVYLTGSGWATADLRATVAGNILTLAPNTIADPDPYWYVTTNSPSVGNVLLEANYYIETPGFWPDQTVTFTGTVLNDSLLAPGNVNPNGQGWTAVAFIKDFASDYSSFDIQTAPLNNGTFTVTHITGPDTLRHLQYGFYVYGPNVWPTDPVLASYGDIQIALLTGPTITPTLSGGNLKLSFPTDLHCTYTVQGKTNLTDATWNSLAVTNGTGAQAVISRPATGSTQFYRLLVNSN